MCWQCDNPTATTADYYRSMQQKIDCYGWAVQRIEGDKLCPDWAYTWDSPSTTCPNWWSPACRRTGR